MNRKTFLIPVIGLLATFGLGGSIVQLKPVHLGASVTWGGRFALSETHEGFDNNLFRDVGELRLNFEASIYF